jgi:uncharacterized protein (TIGR03067 family)
MDNNNLEILLYGAWKIVKTVISGEVKQREEDDEHFLWFLEDKIVTGDEWAAWEMPYEIKKNKFPIEIDIVRDDLNESFLDKGIISISNKEIILCMAGHKDRQRPSEFESNLENNQTLYIGIKCNEPLPE